MRNFEISSAKQGVTRLRNKGGASKDSFYTLRNCYVTADRSIVPRPGTRLDTTLPDGTKGLMVFRGKLYVFSSEPMEIDNDKYVVMVLQHPDPDSGARIDRIHFAEPFLGYPYVVAQFDDDPDKYHHYWLQETGNWKANHVYMLGEVIQPTDQNGYSYSAQRSGPPNPAWEPNKPVVVGDIIEPTKFNGYAYEVIAAEGFNPSTGSTEPAWVAQDGAIVYEDSDLGVTGSTKTVVTGSNIPSSVEDRYKNQGGSAINVIRVADEE